jgi:hypothetical protein
MPYKVKGKCVYKKDTGKKVGCTRGSVKKYLAALHANVDETKEEEPVMEITKTQIREMIEEEFEGLLSDLEEELELDEALPIQSMKDRDTWIARQKALRRPKTQEMAFKRGSTITAKRPKTQIDPVRMRRQRIGRASHNFISTERPRRHQGRMEEELELNEEYLLSLLKDMPIGYPAGLSQTPEEKEYKKTRGKGKKSKKKKG